MLGHICGSDKDDDDDEDDVSELKTSVNQAL